MDEPGPVLWMTEKDELMSKKVPRSGVREDKREGEQGKKNGRAFLQGLGSGAAPEVPFQAAGETAGERG